jgi:hypothetical protein
MGFGIRFAPSERPAFELRYRSPPAPRPARPRARRFHSDSRLSYDRTRRFHFMIWAGLGPYLISHYARYLTLVSQGYSYVFLITFLRRLFDPIAAYPRHLHKIREVRRSVAVTVAASPAPPPPPC